MFCFGVKRKDPLASQRRQKLAWKVSLLAW